MLSLTVWNTVLYVTPSISNEPSTAGSAAFGSGALSPVASSHTMTGSILVGWPVCGLTGPSVGATPKSLRRRYVPSSFTRNGDTVLLFMYATSIRLFSMM